MTSYLLIGLVIVLALAPLLHFLPSKRQRSQARMREIAAVNGLFVEFRDPPGGDRLPAERRRNLIYYGLRLPPAREPARGRCQWLRDGTGWRSLGARVPAPTPLSDLPEEVVAASIDEVSCGIYWQEEGGEERVEQIQRALLDWAKIA